MPNQQEQLQLRLLAEEEVELTTEARRELVELLARLLLAVAGKGESKMGGDDDEHEDP